MPKMVTVDTVWTEVPGPWPDGVALGLPEATIRGTHWVFAVVDAVGVGRSVQITEATIRDGALVDQVTVRLPAKGMDALVQFYQDFG